MGGIFSSRAEEVNRVPLVEKVDPGEDFDDSGTPPQRLMLGLLLRVQA